MARAAFHTLLDVTRTAYDYDELPTVNTRVFGDILVYEQHHTGGVGPKSLSFEHKRKWILQIERYHEWTKRWTDVFYHLFVFADGEVWQGRNPLRTSQGNISDALTVHIPGNNTLTTEAQHVSLLRIARWCTDRPQLVRDHQQRPASTSCSGSNGRITIARLRKELNTMSDSPLHPEDLGTHKDWLAANQSGFLDGQPERAASRSVVGVVATRVNDHSVDRDTDLDSRIDSLAEEIATLRSAGRATASIVETQRVAILSLREISRLSSSAVVAPAVNTDVIVNAVVLAVEAALREALG